MAFKYWKKESVPERDWRSAVTTKSAQVVGDSIDVGGNDR